MEGARGGLSLQRRVPARGALEDRRGLLGHGPLRGVHARRDGAARDWPVLSVCVIACERLVFQYMLLKTEYCLSN